VKERGPAEPPARLPSGRHDIPKDVVVRSQRTRILEALTQTAAERGYAAATVAQVTRRAGVSSATFYELFHDKEDCFLAAIREIIAQATTVVTEASGRRNGDLDRVSEGIRSLLELFAEQPAYARLLFLECRGSTPRALDLYMSGARALLSMLGHGWAADASGVSPAIAARAALGGSEALVRNEIAAGRVERLPELLPQLVYCAVVPFRGQDEAISRSTKARERVVVGG
jgi:AcrR family transcriptional regulator